MKKHTTRSIRKNKVSRGFEPLSMLTCYDFQSAKSLNQSQIDLILVGDSLANVILGEKTTLKVSTEVMALFSKAVSKGAPDKFIVCDIPFGVSALGSEGVSQCIELFKSSGAQALKLEGAFTQQLSLIKTLTEAGVPVMGHIGLRPQSVHEQGGYYTHGKNEQTKQALLKEACLLQEAGCFSIVLECISPECTKQITSTLDIPTIGIGSGRESDGQVLVLNDLIGSDNQKTPSFCEPLDSFFTRRVDIANQFIAKLKKDTTTNDHQH